VSLRNTLILIGVLVLMVAGLYAVRVIKAPKSEPKPPEVWSVKEEDITHIDLRMPQIDKSASFQLGEDGYWHFNDARKSPVDLKRWGGIVLLVSSPQSRRLLAEKANDLKEYGLAQPQMIVKITVKKQPSVEIYIGDKTPSGEAYFVMVQGHDPVYLLDSTWFDVYERLVKEPPKPPFERMKTVKE